MYRLFYFFVISCFAGTLICFANSFQQASLIAEGQPAIGYLPSSDLNKLNPSDFNEWYLFSYAVLAGGINIHPTYFSVYLTFCIVFLLFRLHSKSTLSIPVKFIHWFVIGYFLLFTVLLSSRIITLCLLIGFTSFVIYQIRSRQVRTLSFMIPLLLLTLQLLYLNPVSRYRSLQEVFTTSLTIEPNHVYVNSTEIRASLWWTALKSFAHVNPLWGAGTGDVETVMRETSEKNNITNILNSYDPHNQYLYTLLSHGVIGLLLLFYCLGLSAYIGYVRQDYLYLAFLFVFVCLCITESALERQKGVMFFALFWSLLTFHAKSHQLISINLKPIESAGS